MNLESCQSCTEPTKRPVGFYDRQGPGGTLEGGVMYACDNMDCPLSKERLEGYARARVQKQEAQRENAAPGIHPDDAAGVPRGTADVHLLRASSVLL